MLKFFRNLLKLPDFEDETKARAASLLQNILLAMWLFPVLILVIMVFAPNTISTVTMPFLALFVLLSVLTYLLRHGYVRVASFLLQAGTILIAIYVTYQSGGTFSSTTVAFIPIILIGSLLFGARGGTISLVVLLVQEGILGWAGQTGLIQSNTAAPTALLSFLVLTTVCIVSLSIFQLAASSLTNALELSQAKEREVRSLSEDLEVRVQQRTAELNRRSAQLEAAALVARAAAEVRDLKELLKSVVDQITERFNFYHAGIFLTDVNEQYVILEAASSEGGKRMIERGHRLEIGRQGIVGFAAVQKRPRIAQDVGEDAVFFNNPDLPETHSEVALPLLAQNQLIGILDIQSLERNAFSSEDIHTLQSMADQIALAIENARLIDNSRAAIEELQMLTSESTFQLWKDQLSRPAKAYSYSSLGTSPVSSLQEAAHSNGSEASDEHTMKFPIALRGQKIGVLTLKRKPSASIWTDAEKEMASKIALQIALAIENARLLEDSQMRASRERTIGEVATRITSSIDIESILRTTVQELGRIVPDSEVVVRLQEDQNGHK